MQPKLKKTLRAENRPSGRGMGPLAGAAILVATLALSACEKKFTGETQVYTCSDNTRVEVVYSQDHDKALIRLGDKSYKLSRIRSGTGTKYSNGRVEFWKKGNAAIVQIDGYVAHDGCHLAE